jgi:hypothetical protein
MEKHKMKNGTLPYKMLGALLVVFASGTVMADEIGGGRPSNTPDAHEPIESESTGFWQQLLEWFDLDSSQ